MLFSWTAFMTEPPVSSSDKVKPKPPPRFPSQVVARVVPSTVQQVGAGTRMQQTGGTDNRYPPGYWGLIYFKAGRHLENARQAAYPSHLLASFLANVAVCLSQGMPYARVR